jgi:hypothetical protein
MVPKKTANLLVAGRSVSATHEALGAIRVMPPCFAMGEAAGVAAAGVTIVTLPVKRFGSAGFVGALRIFRLRRISGAAPAGIPLQNAADAGVVMPWSGAGSGGYTGTAAHFGEYPENWDACADPQCLAPDPPGFNSSALAVEAALYSYLVLGGRRIDSSASYHSQAHAGAALSTSRLARGDVFFTSKVGPFLAMGGPEARQQFAGILATSPWLQGRVDLLLIHWPSCIPAEGGSSCPTPPPPSPSARWAGRSTAAGSAGSPPGARSWTFGSRAARAPSA